MTITYNGKNYYVTGESIYKDFSIIADSLDDAVSILTELDGISTYIFNDVEYTDMVVTKRTITVARTITVGVTLRPKTEAEKAKEELETLRQAISELSGSVSKANATKIQTMLKGVSV
jgi:cell division protein ZapA (FtsZ GTPase activity inhibitor)